MRSLFFFLLAASPLWASDGGALRGRVVNGSGGGLPDPVEIRLVSFGAAGGVWEDADGRDGFLFENLPAGDQAPFLIHGTYLGVVYTDRILLRPGQDTTVVFQVYDTTAALAPVRVEDAEIDLSLVEDRVRIDAVVRVTNATDPPRTIVGSGAGTIRLFLPVPSRELPDLTLAVSQGIMPVRRDPIPTEREDVVALDYPVRPGTTAAAASFELPYPGSFAFETVAPYDIPRLLLVAPADVHIEGDRLVPAHMGAEGVGVFMIEGIAEGDRIAFTTAGGSPSSPEEEDRPSERVFTGPPPFAGIRRYLIALVGAVLFGALIAASRISSRREP